MQDVICFLKRTILISFFLVLLPLTNSYAKAGCCSHHGGVAGCNSATGYQLCRDGTTSPTCKCDGTTRAAPTIRTPKTETPKVKTPRTKKAPETVYTPQTTKSETVMKTKGCCAKHGGVKGCDKASGYVTCKDGTRSATCKCN